LDESLVNNLLNFGVFLKCEYYNAMALSQFFADIDRHQLLENMLFVFSVFSRWHLDLVVRDQFFKRHLQQSAGLITLGKYGINKGYQVSFNS